MAELGPEARALLQAGRGLLRPTPADRSRVFAALTSRIGDTTEVSPPRPVAPKAGVASPVLSVFAVGLAVAAVITTVALFRKTSSMPPVAPARASAPVAMAAAPSPSIDVEAPAAERITPP